MDAPLERLRIAEMELSRLESHLRALPPKGWRKPSACAGWEVRDVAAHLAWNADLYTQRVSAGLRGQMDLPAPRPPTGPQKPLNEFVAERAIAVRQRLGDGLFEAFRTSNHAFVDLLRTQVGPGDWDKPCPFYATPVPVRRFVTLRVQELALHSWDVRWAEDRSCPLFPETLPVLVETAKETAARVLKAPHAGQAPARFRFQLSGPGAQTVDLVVNGSGAREERPNGTPGVTLACETGTFVLLLYGRLKGGAALASGQLTATGDRALAGALGRWLGTF